MSIFVHLEYAYIAEHSALQSKMVRCCDNVLTARLPYKKSLFAGRPNFHLQGAFPSLTKQQHFYSLAAVNGESRSEDPRTGDVENRINTLQSEIRAVQNQIGLKDEAISELEQIVEEMIKRERTEQTDPLLEFYTAKLARMEKGLDLLRQRESLLMQRESTLTKEKEMLMEKENILKKPPGSVCTIVFPIFLLLSEILRKSDLLSRSVGVDKARKYASRRP